MVPCLRVIGLKMRLLSNGTVAGFTGDFSRTVVPPGSFVVKGKPGLLFLVLEV